MQYNELNGHFRERIRDRVAARLQSSLKPPETKIDTNARDFIVLCIILLADENNIPRAVERLYKMKKEYGVDSFTNGDALNWIVKVYERFPTEVSILVDLYEMQETQQDIMDIIAHMELRLMED